MEKVGRNDPCPCGSGKKFNESAAVFVARRGDRTLIVEPEAQNEER